MNKILFGNWKASLLTISFILLSTWCVYLNIYSLPESFDRYLFGATYGLVALWGGLNGLLISQKWGGWDSLMGKAIMLLSAGLLAQEFGQLVFSYYNIFLHEPVPYPSLADIGYFGSIFFYVAGILVLGKAAGIKYTFHKVTSKIQTIAFPVVGLIAAYLFFLQGYEFDFSDPLRIILDFGYPLGQSLFISLAVLVYVLSTNVLGGMMRTKILFLLAAFVFQFIADYNFLIQSSRGTWQNGGYGDWLYLVAYFLMTIGIFRLEQLFEDLKKKRVS